MPVSRMLSFIALGMLCNGWCASSALRAELNAVDTYIRRSVAAWDE